MRTPDLIAVVYFVYVIAAAAAVRDVAVERRLRVAGMAGGAILLVLLSGQILRADSVVRDWLPAIWLVLGYWLPGGLLHEPMPGVEAWLKASDRWIQDTPWARTPPAWLSAVLELAYFLVHVFVPAGFLVVVMAGLDDAAVSEQFWTPVLLAGYACYGTLPWLQARPPRLVESADTRLDPSPQPSDTLAPERGEGRVRGLSARMRVRGWNEWLLGLVSVKANTFPSGHVAVALVVGLVVFDLLPVAGAIFVPAALLIAAATVVRRYHYTADAALGLIIAVVCWAGSRLMAG